jgi:hemerythrin-like domain-containing protein
LPDAGQQKKPKKRLAELCGGSYLLGRQFAFVQVMKITEILLAEHAVFHNLFDHIEKTAPRLKTLAEVKSLAALLESVLRAHSQTEDELLIEPLEHCFEQIGQRDTFHDEHEEIDETLLDLQKARDLKTARRLLLRAVAASRKHFDKEERIVFPMAERVLNARTLSALGDRWAVRRSAASE